MSGFTVYAVEYQDKRGRLHRVPCLDREGAMKLAGELFDKYLGVRVVEGVSK